MIHLESIKLKAFRSFLDETFIDLPRTGLILINGNNIDTNDASGTGKSSIFYATAYALNILPSGLPAKDLQCFYTKEKMQVVVTLSDSDAGKIVVARGKENYIEYSGQRFEGSSLVNEHLVKVFGLSSEMLSTLVLRPQNSGGLILSKNSTELVEFLSSLLGLDKIEQALDTSAGIIKDLSKDIASFDSQITSKQEVLNQIKLEDVSALEEHNKTFSEEMTTVEKERQQWEANSKEATKVVTVQIAAAKAKFADLKKQAHGFIVQLQTEDKVLYTEIEKHNAEVTAQINTVNFNHFFLKQTKHELVKLEKEIELLEKAVCFTCNRDWTESGGKLDAARLQQQKSLMLIATEPQLLEQKTQLQALIKTWVPNPKIKDLEKTIQDFHMQEMNEVPIGGGTGDINMMLRCERKINELSSFISANKIVIGKQTELKRLHDQITKDLAKITALKATKETNLQIEEDFTRVVGKAGFLGSIFDEVLQEIVNSINARLATVANMASVTFDFKTETLNSKGLVKKSIVPMVSILGYESRLNGLSGGMLSSLELITDLAVKEVIEARTGKQIGFYFADEVFNGQGLPSKEACFEVLKQGSDKRSIFVIDHHSDFKEFFSKIIDIEMSKGVSKLV